MTRTDYAKLLIHSQGSSPSATQRSRIAMHWKASGRTLHVALMTDSLVSRGLLTAIEWIVNSGTIKALPLDELNAALQWLQVECPTSHVATAIARLRGALRSG